MTTRDAPGAPILLPLAMALLSSFFLLPSACADDAPGKSPDTAAKATDHKVPVPVGRPIQLDGRVLDAEWAPAKVLPLGDGLSQLRLMQYRGMLMIAFESKAVWRSGTTLTLFFAHPGAKDGSHGKGASSIQYEPFAHDRAHVFAFHNGPDGFLRVPDQVVARSAINLSGSAAEFAFPLTFLGMEKDKPTPIRFCAFWSQANARGASYPKGLDWTGAKPRQRPPALMTTDAWATLEGLADPGGPGAFSKTDWDAWLKDAQEMTSRGSQAHAAVNLLREEWKDTRKSDAELEEQILDEFAWIAEREPLTSADLIAMAEVLRFLNRHDRALGIWDTLVSRKEPGVGNYARWQRAKTLEAAERFLEAAKDWDALAASGNALAKSQNEQRAQWARTMHEDWTREQEARRAASASGDLPLVALHTNRGVIVIELFAKDVPKAAAHFLQLVDEKAYDKTCFHRVHGEFMCQGGDPKSRTHGCEFAGAGTSGREIELEVNPTHKLWRGAVAFAHKPHDPRNGSQFFIMTAPAPKLGTYTVFGHVVAGQAAADRIEYDDKLTKAVVLRRGPDAGGQSTQAPDKPK